MSDTIKDSAAKIKHPVIFLSLSRLFPIGESESNLKKNKSILTYEDKLWFIDNYNAVFRVNEGIKDVTVLNIAELSKKKHVGIVTDQYDAITNSSGQSNISQILLALLSFKKLKEMLGDEYSGGILLIDEIESTLHPAAQVNLIKKFIEFGRVLNLQIIMTTHSLAVLEYICRKVQNNNVDSLNNVELSYLTKANDFLEIKRNVNFHFIESDMFNRCSLLSSERSKLFVYSEDQEARWLFSKLIGDYSNLLVLIDITLGADVLITFNKNDTTGHFKETLVLLDGNERDKVNRSSDTNHNILLLPSSKRPEEMIYDYLLELPQNHELLEKCSDYNFTKQYIRDEIGPYSDKYKDVEKDRDKFKKWFIEVKTMLEILKVVDYWIEDYKDDYKAFLDDFKYKYNILAGKNALAKIKD